STLPPIKPQRLRELPTSSSSRLPPRSLSEPDTRIGHLALPEFSPGRGYRVHRRTIIVPLWRRPPSGESHMPILAEVLDYHDDLTAIRRDIHAHPELAFAEQRTADLVAAKLAEFGCEVYRGLAGTGVVGTIRNGNEPGAVGLRADMDALPIQEINDFSHRSSHDGRMHACGHDGHTTMLLGAARYLAATRNFEGAVHL